MTKTGKKRVSVQNLCDGSKCGVGGVPLASTYSGPSLLHNQTAVHHTLTGPLRRVACDALKVLEMELRAL